MTCSDYDKIIVHKIIPIQPLGSNKNQTNFDNNKNKKNDKDQNFDEIFKKEIEKLK